MSILKAPQQSIVMGGRRGNCTGCAKRVIDTLTRSVRTWLRCYDRHNLCHEPNRNSFRFTNEMRPAQEVASPPLRSPCPELTTHEIFVVTWLCESSLTGTP